MSHDPDDDDNCLPPEDPPRRGSQNSQTDSPFIQQVRPQSPVWPSPSTDRAPNNAQQANPTVSNSQPQGSTSPNLVVVSPSASSASSSTTTTVNPSISIASTSRRSSPVNQTTPGPPAAGNSLTEDPFLFLYTWPPFNWDHHPIADQMFNNARLLRAYLNRTGFREGRPISNSHRSSQRSIGTQTSSRSSSHRSGSRSRRTGSSVYRTLSDEDDDNYNDDDDEDIEDNDDDEDEDDEDDEEEEEEDEDDTVYSIPSVRHRPKQYFTQRQSNQRKVSKQKSRVPKFRDQKSQPRVSQAQLKAALSKLKASKSHPQASNVPSSTVGKSNLSKSSNSSQGHGTIASSNTSVVTAYGSASGLVNSGTDVPREQGNPSNQNSGGQNSASNQPQNLTSASRSDSDSPRGSQDPSSPSGRSGSSSTGHRNS